MILWNVTSILPFSCYLIHRFFTTENTQIPVNDLGLPHQASYIRKGHTCPCVLCLFGNSCYKFKTSSRKTHQVFGAAAGDLFVFLCALNMCFILYHLFLFWLVKKITQNHPDKAQPPGLALSRTAAYSSNTQPPGWSALPAGWDRSDPKQTLFFRKNHFTIIP